MAEARNELDAAGPVRSGKASPRSARAPETVGVVHVGRLDRAPGYDDGLPAEDPAARCSGRPASGGDRVGGEALDEVLREEGGGDASRVYQK